MVCISKTNNDHNCESIDKISPNTFKLKVISFLKTLENNLHLEHSAIEKIKINLKIVEKSCNKSCQCHAIVENLDGRTYQCTRKKKYGSLCGLHHNRKNSFKTIDSIEKAENHQFFLDIYSLISKSQQIDQYKLHTITYNYINYLMDSSNGNVYINDYDTDDDEDEIMNFSENIQLTKYNKSEITNKLVFIGNINKLNMPFKIM
jgi:hypothetical protein